MAQQLHGFESFHLCGEPGSSLVPWPVASHHYLQRWLLSQPQKHFPALGQQRATHWAPNYDAKHGRKGDVATIPQFCSLPVPCATLLPCSGHLVVLWKTFVWLVWAAPWKRERDMTLFATAGGSWGWPSRQSVLSSPCEGQRRSSCLNSTCLCGRQARAAPAKEVFRTSTTATWI